MEIRPSSLPCRCERVGTGSGELDDIVQVSVGRAHSCALNDQKNVLCWGAGSDYQLGTGTSDQANRPVAATTVSEDIIQIATGGWHTCALTAEGKVLCWGSTGNGRLGHGSNTGDQGTQQSTPVNVIKNGSDLTNIVQIAAGNRSNCALTQAGGVECWGKNNYGQLGDNTKVTKNSAVSVLGLSGIVEIVGGRENFCALSNIGFVHCWGRGGNGQLGHGIFSTSSVPVMAKETNDTLLVPGMHRRSYWCKSSNCTLSPVAINMTGGDSSRGFGPDLSFDILASTLARPLPFMPMKPAKEHQKTLQITRVRAQR